MQTLKEQIQELKALRERATKGEWHVREHANNYTGGLIGTFLDDEAKKNDISGFTVAHGLRDRDSDYIIALHNLLPAFLTEYEKLEEENKRLARIEDLYTSSGGQLTANGEPKTEELEMLRREAAAGRELAEVVEEMDTKIGLPPQYEPREMSAFKNGWNSNDDKWKKERDTALSAYEQAIKE